MTGIDARPNVPGGHRHEDENHHASHEHHDGRVHTAGVHAHDVAHGHDGERHDDRGHAHAADRDHAHGHADNHGHGHGSGPLAWLGELFGGHSHGVPTADPVLESSAEGIRAVKISLVGLAITAVLQAVIVLFSGSVALLADTIHN